MKPRSIAVALLAAMLAACSEADRSAGSQQAGVCLAPGAAEPVPVRFSPYLGRTGTRSAVVGPIDTRRLHAPDCGFGVFAYATGRVPYADFRTIDAAAPPNFMCNEHIVYDSLTAQWCYAPPSATRFWPLSDDATALFSFFAYAPFDEGASLLPTPSTLPAVCDPHLRHTLAADPHRQVDLLWGCPLVYHPDSDATHAGVLLGRDGIPVDLTFSQTDGLVILHFKHALAKLDTIRAVLDVAAAAAASALPSLANTRVTLNAVTIRSDSLPTTGLLNLATGQWVDHALTGAVPALSFTAPLHADLAEPQVVAAPVHTLEWFSLLPQGVTTVPKPVCRPATAPMFFLPGTSPVLDVTVDYTVRSYDAKLADKYTEVRQAVTKRLSVRQPLLLNHRYELLLHIALHDVSFTATVAEWEADPVVLPGFPGQPDTPQTLPIDVAPLIHVYLPANVSSLP